jgi:hypothetical protein
MPEPNCYGFAPFSKKPYRRLGLQAMTLLHELDDKAARPGRVLRTSLQLDKIVAEALRESSIGLIRRNFFCYQASAGMPAMFGGASHGH